MDAVMIIAYLMGIFISNFFMAYMLYKNCKFKDAMAQAIIATIVCFLLGSICVCVWLVWLS
jgi:hypothetical protein